MPRLYIYKCPTDCGTAPCVDDGLYTLAICKPRIRQSAEVGDWVFAFGCNNEDPPNRLICIAIVSDVLTLGRYYDEPQYQHRSDNIYRRRQDGHLEHGGHTPVHATERDRQKDIGLGPVHRQAVVLIAKDFRYFGRAGTNAWQNVAPMLARKLHEEIGQGHRVNHREEIEAELRQIKEMVWRDYPVGTVHGTPLHGKRGCDPRTSIGLDVAAKVTTQLTAAKRGVC